MADYSSLMCLATSSNLLHCSSFLQSTCCNASSLGPGQKAFHLDQTTSATHVLPQDQSSIRQPSQQDRCVSNSEHWLLTHAPSRLATHAPAPHARQHTSKRQTPALIRACKGRWVNEGNSGHTREMAQTVPSTLKKGPTTDFRSETVCGTAPSPRSQ